MWVPNHFQFFFQNSNGHIPSQSSTQTRVAMWKILRNRPKFIQLRSISKLRFSEINTNSDITPPNNLDGKAGGSSGRPASTAACNDKRQAWPPMDYFKRPLEENCPNHTYCVRHKLKGCSMIRSFMTSGSLT
jgi:hypothetical protein